MPAACVASSLKLSISAETIHTASHFKLPSEYKTLGILFHPIVPSPETNTGKEGDCKSNSITSQCGGVEFF
jgi:hypothetical protein